MGPRVWASALLLVWSASGQLFDVEITYNVPYGRAMVNCTNGTACRNEAELTLDVYAPVGRREGGPRSALVIIHGGSYCILDSNETGEVAQARSLRRSFCLGADRRSARSRGRSKNLVPLRRSRRPRRHRGKRYFAARGFVAASINYRLSGDRGQYPGGYGAFVPLFNASTWWGNNWDHMYPAVRDAKAAIRWVRAHRDALDVDARRVGVAGSSAGAASVMAIVGSFDDDFAAELRGRDPTLASTNPAQSSTADFAIAQWGAAYGAEALEWKDGASRVTAASPPAIAFHGTDDTVIVDANSRWLCDRYARVGAACDLHLLRGYGHGAWNATVRGASQNALALAFIQKHRPGAEGTSPT